MNAKASFLFAKRILFPKSGRLTIARKSLTGAILCIGISLTPLVVVLAVSNGMIDGITRRMISFSSSHLEAVSLSKDSDKLQDSARIAQSLDEIDAAYPMIEFSALAVSKNKRCGISVRALPQEIFERLPSYHEMFQSSDGDIKDFVSSKKAVMIGKGVAEKLGLGAGDKIRVVTIKKGSAGKITPGIHFYTVAAVVSCGYRELDALWLFMPFDEGRRLSRSSDASLSVMCELPNPFSPQIAGVQKKLSQSLGKDYRVYRWDQLNKAQYENFSSTKILLLFIQLLIVLVASVNISSALGMLALERRREIAILKSLGASPSGVSFAFLLTGFACGAAGLVIGIPAGLLVSVNVNAVIRAAEKAVNFALRGLYFLFKNDIMEFSQISLLNEEYYLTEIPVNIPFGDLFLIGAATLLLSLFVSVFPAIKAGRNKPLDTLRDSR
ncbi:MAG: ABC transporter permease [Treponema sp.]|nr:ABC transporter permease [Treponema sp.]